MSPTGCHLGVYPTPPVHIKLNISETVRNPTSKLYIVVPYHKTHSLALTRGPLGSCLTPSLYKRPNISETAPKPYILLFLIIRRFPVPKPYILLFLMIRRFQQLLRSGVPWGYAPLQSSSYKALYIRKRSKPHP